MQIDFKFMFKSTHTALAFNFLIFNIWNRWELLEISKQHLILSLNWRESFGGNSVKIVLLPDM